MVLAELHLSGMGGLELCQALRSPGRESTPYFVMMTGIHDPRLLEMAFESGVDDYLSKPFEMVELRARLRAGVRVLGMAEDLIERHDRRREQDTHDVLVRELHDVVGALAHDLRTPMAALRTNVQRLTAPNPGMMTGPGTNTYIVGTPGDRIVIDPGPALPEHVERLAQAVRDDLRAIVCTHSHPDHSPAAPLLRERVGRDVPTLGLPSAPTARPHSAFTPDRALADGERLRCGDATLRVIHTPGHAANHLCLVLEEDRLLFSGDHVLNGSTTVVDPPDGDMHAYLASLRRLAAEPVDFILPAHGHVLGPARQAIERLIAHRLGREAKVLGVLRDSGGGTLATLVAGAYDDVPTTLHPVAQRSLLAHLEKLAVDGLATRDGDRWRATR